LFIRVTHWLNTCAFLALCISGVAILMAHPRLYWGESGGAGSPALMELPLPLDTDESGWGRSLHFFAAWVCLLTGTLYVLRGLQSRHFGAMRARYEAPQRGAYMAVIFVLFPLMIASGLAMSPAVNAALPFIVRLFGGQQSSRTLHFIVANLLVLFLALHVVMVYRSGFRKKMRGMVMGR
jgi:thiosulfate reductase cytochrome b subunit